MQQFVTRFGCLPGVSSRPRTILIPGVLAYSNLSPVFTTNGRNGPIIATKRALHKLTWDSAKTELLLRFSIRLLAEGLVFERENMMNSCFSGRSTMIPVGIWSLHWPCTAAVATSHQAKIWSQPRHPFTQGVWKLVLTICFLGVYVKTKLFHVSWEEMNLSHLYNLEVFWGKMVREFRGCCYIYIHLCSHCSYRRCVDSPNLQVFGFY